MSSEEVVNSLARLSLGTPTGQDTRELGPATPKKRGKRKQRQKRRGNQNDGPPKTQKTEDSEESTKRSIAETTESTDSSFTRDANAKTTAQRDEQDINPKSTSLNTSDEIDRPRHIYVVQIRGHRGGEKIVGVFAELVGANSCAVRCAARYGISAAEIASTGGIFGARVTTSHITRATRVTWANGTSEIRSKEFEWIKVLPKTWNASVDGDTNDIVYLALDKAFVVGAYGSKEDAWEACKEYWAQLSYWTTIDVTKWVDRLGMPHANGNIQDSPHHWFVCPFPINVEVD